MSCSVPLKCRIELFVESELRFSHAASPRTHACRQQRQLYTGLGPTEYPIYKLALFILFFDKWQKMGGFYNKLVLKLPSVEYSDQKSLIRHN